MTLYRRSKKPGASYYVQFFHKGRRIQYCTGKSDYYEARTEAMRHEAEVKLGRVAVSQPSGSEVTVGMVCDRYLAMALHVQEDTRKRNVDCLFRLLRQSGYTRDSSATVLDANLIKRYQCEREKDPTKNSPVGINATVRQARSIFSEKSMGLYRDMALPDLKPVLDVPPLKEPRTHYVPPARSFIETLSTKAAQLKANDPHAYVGFVLAMYTGMRPGEVIASRWEWVKALPSGAVIEVPAAIAKSEKPRLIPIGVDVLNELRSISPRAGYIIPEDNDWKRSCAVGRRLSSWLKENGVKGKAKGKTVYELRKYFGSMIATQHGLFVAQRLLGHSSPEVTSKYYASLIDLPPPIEMMAGAAG